LKEGEFSHQKKKKLKEREFSHQKKKKLKEGEYRNPNGNLNQRLNLFKKKLWALQQQFNICFFATYTEQ